MSVDPKKFGITSSLIETVKEALKGSQHKIDVAEPKGKITGADFKKLRGEGSYMVGPPVKPEAPLDTVNRVASDLKKMASEPIKPMGSKTSSTTSLPKATFSLKPPMGEGAKPDFLDLDKDGNKKEPMKHAAKHAKEEVEQVDETSDEKREKYKKSAERHVGGLVMKTGLKRLIGMNPSDDDSDAIRRRVQGLSRSARKSKNSDDAYDAAAMRHNLGVSEPRRGKGKLSLKKEEAEQVDEVLDTANKKMKYIEKAGKQIMDYEPYKDRDGKGADRVRKRTAGAQMLQRKIAKKGVGPVVDEEVEQVDELSKSTLGSYVKKASGRVADKSRHAGDIENRRDVSPAAKEVLAKHDRKIDNSLKGISRATDRLAKEEVEMTEAESHAAKQIAARKDAMKTHLQNKIAKKQMSAMQAKANQRLKNINASNDKCSCGDTNESKMKCEMHGGKDAKMGREKIEVNPPLREAEDLPKKVVTKGHEIAKSLIKNKAKVREPYAVGMAQAKKSAGIKD